MEEFFQMIGEQLYYIELVFIHLQKYTSMVSRHEMLFSRWLRDCLAVIPM